jgi:hypothetical protein
MKWFRAWVSRIATEAIINWMERMRETLKFVEFSKRIEEMDGKIRTAETRVQQAIDLAIGDVDRRCKNEFGRIVWQNVQLHERDSSILIRSDIEDLSRRYNELRGADQYLLGRIMNLEGKK